MKKILPAVISIILSSCAPQQAAKNPSQARDTEKAEIQLASSNPKKQLKGKKKNRKINYSQATKKDIETAINYIIRNSVEIIKNNDPFEYKSVNSFAFELRNSKKIQVGGHVLEFTDRTLSINAYNSYSHGTTYSLEFEGQYKDPDNPGIFRYLHMSDGFVKKFDTETLTFWKKQVEIDGFPDYETSGSALETAVIHTPDSTETNSSGSCYANVFTATIKEIRDLNTAPVTVDLERFPQSLGYPLYQNASKNRSSPGPSLPELPGRVKDSTPKSRQF